MRHLILLFSLLSMINIECNSQQKAVIKESGKEVVLFDNGTWNYSLTDSNEVVKIDTLAFSKLITSDYLLESSKLKYGIWINKKKWDFSTTENTGTTPTEFNFKLKGEDAYGMIIAEKIEIPIDNLLDIAFHNAQNAAPDTKLIKKECRNVNGKFVHFMQMEGTIQGIKFVYLGYYYSDENGSIQFLTYTSQNLLKQYKAEMESLLNGFIIR